MINVLIGIPGCGKSTFAESGKIPGVVLSSDAIREEFFTVDDMNHNREVFAILEKKAEEHVKNGDDIIIDATNIYKTSRKFFVDLARKMGVELNAYTFEDIPLNVCLRRNANRERKVPEWVIENMHRKISSPSTEEGFANIFVVDVNLQIDLSRSYLGGR